MYFFVRIYTHLVFNPLSASVILMYKPVNLLLELVCLLEPKVFKQTSIKTILK